MASRYTPISLSEVQEVLKPEKGWIQDNSGNEIVFNFPLTTRPYIVLKVYSTLRNSDTACRKCGQDAIRVFAVNEKTGRGWITTRKVLRVQGWRKNLTNAVLDIFKQAQNRRG